jgi:hypothetical protein
MTEYRKSRTNLDPAQRRLRFELIFASVWLAVGLFVVPALIFWVGITLLGPYGDGTGEGLGSFYADFFGDLATGDIRTWLLALGPLILISLIRLVFIGVRGTDESPEKSSSEPPTPRTVEPRRIEPRIGD